MEAVGYLLKENKEYSGALQYQGSSPMGMNKNIIWIKSDFNDHMKLVLASALCAILQLKTLELENQN